MDYIITTPSGEKFRISGPGELTPAQLREKALQLEPPAKKDPFAGATARVESKVDPRGNIDRFKPVEKNPAGDKPYVYNQKFKNENVKDRGVKRITERDEKRQEEVAAKVPDWLANIGRSIVEGAVPASKFMPEQGRNQQVKQVISSLANIPQEAKSSLEILAHPDATPMQRVGAGVETLLNFGTPGLEAAGVKGVKTVAKAGKEAIKTARIGKTAANVGRAIEESTEVAARASKPIAEIPKKVDVPKAPELDLKPVKSVEAPKPAAAAKPVETPKVKPSTVSHADTDKLRETLGFAERESTVLKDKDLMTKAKAHDPFEVAAKVTRGEAASDSEQIALGTRLNVIRKELDQAKAAGDVTKYTEKLGQAETLADALDKAGTEAGRAMRARQLLIDDQFDEFGLKRMLEKDKGSPLTQVESKQIAELVAKNKNLKSTLADAQKQLSELAAKSEIKKTSRQAPRFKKEELDAELDAIMAQWNAAKKEVSGRMNDIGSVIGLYGIEGTQIIFKVATNYAKRGINEIEPLLKEVAKHFPEISREDLIDVIANRGRLKEPRTATDLMKAIGRLQRQAKAQSPTRAKEIQAKIAEYTQRLKDKDFAVQEKDVLAKSKQVEMLEAERDLIRKRFEALRKAAQDETGKGMRFVKATADAIRGTQLGFDLGAIMRQGLFGVTHPTKMLESLKGGFGAMKSDVALQAIENGINKKLINGKPASPVRSKAGLYMADSLSQPEEAFVSKFLKSVPGVGKLYAGGERFTTGFLNTYRAEMFDWFAKKIPDASEKELKDWARWVNSTSGRSNIKEVPDLFQLVMTSPRYTASRFEILHRVFLSANPLGDRASKQVFKEAAKTAGTILAGMKMMEAAGAEINFNPESSDFLKVRVGETVYDPTAGISTTLRLILRSMIPVKRMRPPAFGQDPASQAGKFFAGKASPVVSKSFGLATGSSLTGFDIPEDESGWEQWLPLVAAQAKKNIEKDGPFKGAAKTLPELIGIGSNTYKKSPPRSVTKE